MAKKVTTVLIDDIDKSEAKETVQFALDGINYEIDLNENHARELREAFDRWIKAGRKTTGRRRRGTGSPINSEAREMNRKVRTWAQNKGIKVSDRGRVAASLVEQYRRETGE
ncbi:MAG: Lsr2 family protein [Mobiluncus porci]|uniref:Lsr2 family protein n=1 Tax=Mobiluncus porci TaxID=2652278 RepID=A0A7K0K3C1_9ACTO|nr:MULTISPECIES: Lsr2 family protein [Mobiluncus]MCI6583827.1 Lsr2 family protein [Mobiluncus sp.]MDD7541010.1 Lsr2 family protein [Mobiluncus porci]MDY5748185.1 Lsr2 family protein [Mobiluncus porci]MST49981.1 Lsr2 family protein [Mobiluncus porci]